MAEDPCSVPKAPDARKTMRIDYRTTVADFLVLGTWEALTLLGEARELCDADEVAELLSKAEQILISVVSELPGALPRSAGQTIRANGGISFGKAAAGVESTQDSFEYRSRDRGPREDRRRRHEFAGWEFKPDKQGIRQKRAILRERSSRE